MGGDEVVYAAWKLSTATQIFHFLCAYASRVQSQTILNCKINSPSLVNLALFFKKPNLNRTPNAEHPPESGRIKIKKTGRKFGFFSRSFAWRLSREKVSMRARDTVYLLKY